MRANLCLNISSLHIEVIKSIRITYHNEGGNPPEVEEHFESAFGDYGKLGGASSLAIYSLA